MKLGETALVNFIAENTGESATDGTATFNVQPETAGLYFNKIECFCFTEQTLRPGERVEMPVQFFVSPDMADDRELNGTRTITLSYTFFPVAGEGQPVAQAAGRRERAKACRRRRLGGAAGPHGGWDRTIMAEAHAKHHDYHLVDPSPWPIIGAVSAFVLALGADLRHARADQLAGGSRPACSASSTRCSPGGWTSSRKRTAATIRAVVQLHLRYGMIMFIASEVMFFVAWFWAFFDASLFAGEAAQICARRGDRRALAAGRPRGARPVAPAAPQHADPADLRHDGDLGAPFAAAQRPRRA